MLNLIFAASTTLACLATPLPGIKAKPVGEASFKKAIFVLYDASLCADKTPFTMEGKFSLTLDYKRKFSSDQLVKATIVEMSRLSGRDKSEFAALKQPITACFPDVKKGDQITGVSLGKNTAKFYLNGKLSCDIEWNGFRHDFFGIWLSDNTRAKKQSRRLRGLP